MRAHILLIASLLSTGCPQRGVQQLDTTLPEATKSIDADEPEEILVAGAASLDPSLRGRSLELLVKGADEDLVMDFAPRALFDPDPWVQRVGALALCGRVDENPAALGLLEAYVQRDVDPYVRASVGLALIDFPGIREVFVKAWRQEQKGWRIAPLALVAALLGDGEAEDALAQALRRGDVALEVEFLEQVGGSGLGGLVPALKEGNGRVEEEMELPFAAARLRLGDLSAEGVFRRELSGDNVERQLEAMDYLVAIDGPPANALLRRAKTSGVGYLRWYAALALGARNGEAAAFRQAMMDDDWEIRLLAVRFAAVAGVLSRKQLRV
ncbi:MAG: HEAT repeat domain-containing protein, partial [Proteobacteria bacterium]|nr:HEAT repeat domain-containing protein [Pseudomonadota bacterium]